LAKDPYPLDDREDFEPKADESAVEQGKGVNYAACLMVLPLAQIE
jgi:hypothetical protein